ncbi:MAG: hypothetical protein KGI48_07060 [Hyphomicrobiales bacterium]|nr:hypothetical protein [Hyphomicrobiales bacterium]
MSEERFYCEKCQIDWLAQYSLWNQYTAECHECGAYCSLLNVQHSERSHELSDIYDEQGNLNDTRDLEALAAQQAADLAADMAAAEDADADGEADGDGGEGK